jgi:RNA polymerase sigma-70 factor (ECF subfamily)
LPESTDEQLMLAHQRGAAGAFAELFARYRQAVYGFFRRRLDHAARAEELAQEVFVAVLRGTERWEPRASFRAWLYGIAMKMLWAERRSAAREAGSVAIEAADAPATGAASATAATDAALAVRQAVARLEEGEREVLLLREYEQLRYDEIAALLGVPVGTVRSRLFRARMALKDLLSEKGGTADERR